MTIKFRIILFLFFSVSPLCLAGKVEALVSMVPSDSPVSNLSIQEGANVAIQQQAVVTSIPYTIVTGTYDRTGWNLLCSETPVQLSASKAFQLRIGLSGPRNLIPLKAVGPNGEVEVGTLQIFVPDWNSLAVPKAVIPKVPESTKKEFSLVPSIGYTYLYYRQDLVPGYSETTLSAKVVARYVPHPETPELVFGAFFSTYFPPFGATSYDSSSISFFSGGASLSWVILPPPWQWTVGLGGTFRTTVVNGSNYGYENLTGPDAMMTLERKGESSEFGIQVKYGVFLNQTTFLGFNNFDMIVSLLAAFKVSEEHSFFLGVDLNTLNLLANHVQFSLNSANFNVGLNLI